MVDRITILMADDDDDDYFLAKESLRANNSVAALIRVEDGIELLNYLSGNDFPDLIILDLNMPRKDGREALAEIKGHPVFRQIPIVILSTSNVEADRSLAKEAGGILFLTKPSSFGKWVEMMGSIMQLALGM